MYVHFTVVFFSIYLYHSFLISKFQIKKFSNPHNFIIWDKFSHKVLWGSFLSIYPHLILDLYNWCVRFFFLIIISFHIILIAIFFTLLNHSINHLNFTCKKILYFQISNNNFVLIFLDCNVISKLHHVMHQVAFIYLFFNQSTILP